MDAPDEERLLARLLALGREAFGDGAGIVRLALRPGPGALRTATLVGSTRAIGPEPRLWNLIRSAEPHPGLGDFPGLKREDVQLYDAAREATKKAGVDDALLVDSADRVVEGARSNVFVVTSEGELVTPPLAHGAVAGLAREIVLERATAAHEQEVPFATLLQAREIILVNAVRGAVRIATLDARPVGQGTEPFWSERLHALLLSDPPQLDR